MQKKTSEMPQTYQINLSDFALFLSIMKVKEAYEDVLGIILDESDLKLKEVSYIKCRIQPGSEAAGSRQFGRHRDG